MKIVFTGGGTGGHVIPNLAIIAELKKIKPKIQIFYIGSRDGIEQKIAKKAGIEFHSVTTGKLRRYFSLKNFSDASRIPLGIIQAIKLLRKIKPSVVFAKGGFVSVPTAIAAGILKIPLIIHESDITLGLATKICSKFANKICLSFPPLKNAKLKIKNAQLTGNPVRTNGSAIKGKKFLGFKNKKPIVLVAGGSSGSAFLNQLVSKTLFPLIEKTNIVWLTGENAKCKINPRDISGVNVKVFQFLEKEYLDVLATADLVISRAGANALFEIAAAGKPSILIPLPKAGSRGDQILNAKFFAKSGASIVLLQEKATPKKFTKLVTGLISNKSHQRKMSASAKKIAPKNAAKKIAKLILNEVKK